jgi:hypothetical protein
MQSVPVAQLDRVLDYESRGREFESLRARHLCRSAEVAELADARDSKSRGVTRAGSSPAFGTSVGL